MPTPTTVVNLHHRPTGRRIYIGRPVGGGDPRLVPVGERGFLGNPFADGSRDENIAAFAIYFQQRLAEDSNFRSAVALLGGVQLVCFCKPQACHGDIIAAYVNGLPN